AYPVTRKLVALQPPHLFGIRLEEELVQRLAVLVDVGVFHGLDFGRLEFLHYPHASVVRDRPNRGHRAHGSQGAPDLQGIVDELAVEVDTADPVDPQEFFRDDLAEQLVQFFVLGEPAVPTDIEFELTTLRIPADGARQATNKRRRLHNGRVDARLAQHIRRTQASWASAHDDVSGLRAVPGYRSVRLVTVLHSLGFLPVGAYSP